MILFQNAYLFLSRLLKIVVLYRRKFDISNYHALQHATQPLFGLLKPTCLIVCVSSGFYGGVADGRARVLVRELCCGLDKSVLREAGAVDVRH